MLPSKITDIPAEMLINEAIGRNYTYMVVNSLSYGLLSSFDYTFFFERQYSNASKWLTVAYFKRVSGQFSKAYCPPSCFIFHFSCWRFKQKADSN